MNLGIITNSKSWRRFGQMEVWGWPFFWFTLGFIVVLSYTFDAVRLNNYSPLWIPINAISFLISVALVFGLVKLIKLLKIKQPYLTVVNFLIAAMGMGLKNVTTFLLCEPFGIDDSGYIPFRFLGGTTIGVAIYLVFGNIVAARIERIVVLDELESKERMLVGFRENITEIFTEEEAELKRRTSFELLPRFQALLEKVELGSDAKSLTNDLEQLLSKEVRPLSNELAKEARALSRVAPDSSSIEVPEIEPLVSLYEMVQPLKSYLLIAFCWWMLVQIALPQSTIMDSAIGAFVYLGVFTVIKWALLPVKKVTINQALIASPIVAFLGTVPSYYLFYQIPHTPDQSPLVATILVAGAWTNILFSQSYIVDLKGAALEDKLKQVVSEFTRENKIFEQKMWIAQHVWYTLLHGTVQSALTAATIRASNKKKLGTEDRAAIVRDIKRAMEALRNPVQEKITLDQSLKSLSQTWEGICEIKLQIDAAAQKTIDNSPAASLVVNEIMKEALSNAVKHGEASEALINISVCNDRTIVMLVSNNGSKPVVNAGQGVGSRIFNSVCVVHELRFNSETNQTELYVEIPLA